MVMSKSVDNRKPNGQFKKGASGNPSTQFKANNNLRQAMQDASTKDFKQIKNKYGSADAQWLFLLDYKKYDLDELEGKMNAMAKVSQDVQTFKA